MEDADPNHLDERGYQDSTRIGGTRKRVLPITPLPRAAYTAGRRISGTGMRWGEPDVRSRRLAGLPKIRARFPALGHPSAARRRRAAGQAAVKVEQLENSKSGER